MEQLTGRKQFLVTDEDFTQFRKFGLPVQVFCPCTCKTVAFGHVKDLNHEQALVNGKRFSRNEVIFFGSIIN